MATRFSKSGNSTPLAEEIQGSDIVWSGVAWLCEKQLKHYPSFSRNQTTNISVFSFVRVLGNDKKVFLGYVEDLFEDVMGEKMVRMRPFLFGKDVEALVPKLNPQIREVFITSTELEISAKHIEGPAEILTPRHFNRDLFLTLKCFVCHREFKNNTVKPFSVGKLRGYSTQPIISSLENRAPNPSNCRRKPTAEARPVILGLECIPVSKRKKTEKGLKGKLAKKGDVESIVPAVSQALSKDNQNDYVESIAPPVSQALSKDNQIDYVESIVPPVSQALSKDSQNDYVESIVPPVSQALSKDNQNDYVECIVPPVSQALSKDTQNDYVENIVPTVSQALSKDNQNDYVEVLSLDSGLRGCWFRCKILRTTQNHLRVRHCDVNLVDGPKKLKEWVIRSRPAKPDTLGMRCEGRPTVRPWPPQWDSSDLKFELGVAVDSWLDDGWWEGVITGCGTSSNDDLEVYFPGENNYRTLPRKLVRVSKDWVNNQWVDVKRKTGVISFINSLQKVTLPPLNNSPPVNASSQFCDPVKVRGSELPISSSALGANEKTLNDKLLEQLLKIKETEDWTPRGSGNAAKKAKMGRQGGHGRMA